MGSHIRYIVLTDVHLGAGNSILTQVQPGRTVADTHRPSPALLSLADCLRSLVSGCNGSGRPPSLIAAGDLIDLALSPRSVLCRSSACSPRRSCRVTTPWWTTR